MRSSAILHLLATAVSVELGHPWVYEGGAHRHESRGTIAITPVMIVGARFVTATLFSARSAGAEPGRARGNSLHNLRSYGP